MKRLFKQVEGGWELIEELEEVTIPNDEGVYRIELLTEGGSTIISETEVNA